MSKVKKHELSVGHIYANPDLDQAQELFDELPDSAVDYLIAAFAHAAGFGPHPGKYQGPEVKDPFPTHDGFGKDLPVSWPNARS
jgi:hypothetical protein